MWCLENEPHEIWQRESEIFVLESSSEFTGEWPAEDLEILETATPAVWSTSWSKPSSQTTNRGIPSTTIKPEEAPPRTNSPTSGDDGQDNRALWAGVRVGLDVTSSLVLIALVIGVIRWRKSRNGMASPQTPHDPTEGTASPFRERLSQENANTIPELPVPVYEVSGKSAGVMESEGSRGSLEITAALRMTPENMQLSIPTPSLSTTKNSNHPRDLATSLEIPGTEDLPELVASPRRK